MWVEHSGVAAEATVARRAGISVEYSANVPESHTAAASSAASTLDATALIAAVHTTGTAMHDAGLTTTKIAAPTAAQLGPIEVQPHACNTRSLPALCMLCMSILSMPAPCMLCLYRLSTLKCLSHMGTRILPWRGLQLQLKTWHNTYWFYFPYSSHLLAVAADRFANISTNISTNTRTHTQS